ncbi:MAG: tyrosine recombinase XerC [Dehalococcoidia bacterium]|nr:tyrosine recombinase XerC [Dehalococcoidia bacterium]
MQNAAHGYVECFVDYLEAEKHASRYTVRNYKIDLIGNKQRGTEKGFIPYLKQHNIHSFEEVNKPVMRAYLGYLIDRRTAKASIARKLSAIRSFYRFLAREHIIEHNPLELVVSPKLERHLPEFLTHDEINALLSIPDCTTKLGQRDGAILELFYAAGMRVSELAGLNLHQIDLGSREIRVIGKGSKERLVIIGTPAELALQKYLRLARPMLNSQSSGQAVFLNYKGGRLTERWVQILILKYARAAGISKKVHPHLLRHTFATHLLDGGADLRVVQDLLGHANLSTTQIYTHITQKQARRVYLASHPMAQIKDNENGRIESA